MSPPLPWGTSWVRWRSKEQREAWAEMSALWWGRVRLSASRNQVSSTSSADVSHFSPWGWGWGGGHGLWVTWGVTQGHPHSGLGLGSPGLLPQHLQGTSSLPSFTRSALNPRRHTIPTWPPLQVGNRVRDAVSSRARGLLFWGPPQDALLLAGVQLLGSQLQFEEPELEGVGVLCWPPGQMGPVAAGGPAQSLLGQLPSSVDHASSGPQLLECVGWGQWMGHQMWSSDVEVGASQTC